MTAYETYIFEPSVHAETVPDECREGGKVVVGDRVGDRDGKLVHLSHRVSKTPRSHKQI